MSLKKILLVVSIVIVVIFAFMLSTSYAWYSFQNASTSFTTLTNNEDVVIEYITGESINTSIAVPIKSTDIERYSEKNNFVIRTKEPEVDNELVATISLVDISIAGALQSTNFKVELYHQGFIVSTTLGNSIGTSGATTKKLGTVTLSNLVDNNFEVRIYILDNDTDQSSMMNKTFSAKIKIDIVSRLKTVIDKISPDDILINNITIDGVDSNKIPTSGYYTMSSSCSKGSSLEWDPLDKTITYDTGSMIKDSCDLTFTSSNDYPLLNTKNVGDYVAYVGEGGMVGSTTVNCKLNGAASSTTESAATEAPNSCKGQNAREDLDDSGYTYGYCYSARYKYYTTGWRIAYIKDDKVYLVSAGAPECLARTSSTANVTYIQTANASALKYCNSSYVDGNCNCTDSNADGLCDSPSTDARAIGDTDFYYMTEAISGYGKNLYSGSKVTDGPTGEAGGGLSSTYCGGYYSYKACGYNNDLIDNGGYYRFAAAYSSSSSDGPIWNPSYRYVNSYSATSAYGNRIIISLSSSVYLTGGSGTMDDPYRIFNGEERTYLNEKNVGDYVAYTGSGGKVGGTDVVCQTNGLASSETATAATESPNSCKGQNAREDLENEDGKYGYCYSSSYKFNVKGGWRIAYIKDGKAHLVSAGAPECLTRTNSTANVTYIQKANASALKYCNSTYVDGDCSCEGTSSTCTTPSTDAWAFGDTDFYYTTKAINGIGKRLTDGSSSLGDVGGNLGNTLYCLYNSSQTDCGYNNSLIDNGGFYWFAAAYSSSSSYGPYWYPILRAVSYNSSTSAYGNRIIISLSSDVYVIDGTGTVDDPWVIEPW